MEREALGGRRMGFSVVWMAQYFLRRAASAFVAREEAGSRGTPDPVIPHCARRPPRDISGLSGSSVKACEVKSFGERTSLWYSG